MQSATRSFYERSIGTIENRAEDPSLRPSALLLSYNVGGTADDGGGWLLPGQRERRDDDGARAVHGRAWRDVRGSRVHAHGLGLAAQALLKRPKALWFIHHGEDKCEISSGRGVEEGGREATAYGACGGRRRRDNPRPRGDGQTHQCGPAEACGTCTADPEGDPPAAGTGWTGLAPHRQQLTKLSELKLHHSLGYRSFRDLLKGENLMSESRAFQLMAVAKRYSRAQPRELGVDKAYALVTYVKATPEDDIASLLAEADAHVGGKPISESTNRGS